MAAIVLTGGDLSSALIALESEGSPNLVYVVTGEVGERPIIDAASYVSLRLRRPLSLAGEFFDYTKNHETVPNKLLVLLMAAANYGDTIYLGYTDEEHAEQSQAIKDVLVATGTKIESIECPHVGMSYSEMAEKALGLAGNAWPIKETTYCDMQDKGADKPCGECPRCIEKRNVMDKLNINYDGYFEHEPDYLIDYSYESE